MPSDVLCIGHAAFDTIFYANGFPKENTKLEVRDALTGGGGPAATAACLLGRWGVAAAFAGVVGDDPWGQILLAEFRDAGVDTAGIELRRNHPTPISTILVNTRNGSRTIVNRKLPAGPLRFDPSRLNGEPPAVILADGHELPAAREALDAWPKARAVLDAGSVREGTLALAGRVEALVASERFAADAGGPADLRTLPGQRACLARLRTRFGAPVVAVTLGEQGVIADWGDGFRAIPAERATAVDTTGAGDIFHGAVAYGMLRRMTWPDTLALANRTAALSVTRRGGRQSIPRREEVLPHGR